MTIQVQTLHLSLPDDRFAFVVDQLGDGLQLLKRLGQRPSQVDVTLEKTVQRAPQTRRGERLYRATVVVAVPGGSIRADGQADDLRQAIVQMGHWLVDAVCTRRGEWMEQSRLRKGTVSRTPRPGGKERLSRGDRRADEFPLSRLTRTPSTD